MTYVLSCPPTLLLGGGHNKTYVIDKSTNKCYLSYVLDVCKTISFETCLDMLYLFAFCFS